MAKRAAAGKTGLNITQEVRALVEANKEINRVGATLLSEAIPVSRAAREQAARDPAAKRPLLAALTDGEDFELLFTVASREAVPLRDAWSAQFPELKLSCIGRITAEPGIQLRDRRGSQPFPDHGYVHFAQP